MGSVTVVLGPMFGGKTTAVLGRLHRKEIAGMSTVLLSPAMDVRVRDGIITPHSIADHTPMGETFTASYPPSMRMKAVTCSSIREYMGSMSYRDAPPDVVGIDEGHMFTDLIFGIRDLSLGGREVIVGILQSDFAMNPFPSLGAVVALSDHIIHMKAVCGTPNCRADATFTTCYSPPTDGCLKIGGAEVGYVAHCRRCYLAANRNGFSRLAVGDASERLGVDGD